MLTQEAIFIATIKGTSLVIKTRPLNTVSSNLGRLTVHSWLFRLLAEFCTDSRIVPLMLGVWCAGDVAHGGRGGDRDAWHLAAVGRQRLHSAHASAAGRARRHERNRQEGKRHTPWSEKSKVEAWSGESSESAASG